jgi:hypothetical protein
MARVPSKKTMFGWAIQSTKGQIVSAPVNVWPLGERGGLTTAIEREILRQADGRMHDGVFVDIGESYEGDISIPLIPGFVATGTSDIENIALHQDATTWLSNWFTCFTDLGSDYRRIWRDCKVLSWRLLFETGAIPMFTATIRALSRATGAQITVDAIKTKPYECKEIVVSTGTSGGAYATDYTLKRVELSGEMCIPDAASERRLGTTNCGPYDSPNFSGMRVEGSLDAEFSNSTLISAFENGTELELKVVCTRAGVAVCTVTVPRIVYTANPLLGGGGEGFVEQDGVGFTALGSRDYYATAPVSITEEAP